jgi:hypothetical protein
MSGWQSLALLVVFVLGYLVSWMQWYQPEYRKVRVQKALLLLQRDQIAQLELELHQAEVQDLVLQSALDSIQVKAQGMVSELPQQNLSYWKFEGPRLQQRVLDLEMELDSLRSKTLWKD